MKNTLSNKIAVTAVIVVVAATAGYLANEKKKSYAFGGAFLGLIISALAMPKILKNEVVKSALNS